MYIGNSHRCENSKDNEATLGVYVTFWTTETRMGDRALDFRSEGGDLQVVEEEGNTHGRKTPT